MDERCEHCGSRLGIDCDGVLTWDTDPFQEEIHRDFSKSWDCEGGRYKSAMDI